MRSLPLRIIANKKDSSDRQMRIFIITMDDPVYTVPFIREVIEHRKKDIVGVAISKGDRMVIGKKTFPLGISFFPVTDYGSI